MRTFPGWTLKHLRTGMTGAQASVWYAWAMENESSMMGPVYKRVSDGYVRQERNRLLAELKTTKKATKRK